MQNDETKKTKSARKTTNETNLDGFSRRNFRNTFKFASGKTFLIFCGLLVVIVLSVFLFIRNDHSGKTVYLQSFSIETVTTNAARAKGLGGHAPLKSNEAMLFDFTDGANGQCFWMKDMTFNIDIIWLDSNKYVYKVVQNISPDTYPEESFCTNQNPAYVLETAAGRAAELGIDIGKQLKL